MITATGHYVSDSSITESGRASSSGITETGDNLLQFFTVLAVAGTTLSVAAVSSIQCNSRSLSSLIQTVAAVSHLYRRVLSLSGSVDTVAMPIHEFQRQFVTQGITLAVASSDNESTRLYMSDSAFNSLFASNAFVSTDTTRRFVRV